MLEQKDFPVLRDLRVSEESMDFQDYREGREAEVPQETLALQDLEAWTETKYVPTLPRLFSVAYLRLIVSTISI